jgi:hypothetical protein
MSAADGSENKLSEYEATRTLIMLIAKETDYDAPKDYDRTRDLTIASEAKSLIASKAMVAAQWVCDSVVLKVVVEASSSGSLVCLHSLTDCLIRQGPLPMDLAIEANLLEVVRCSSRPFSCLPILWVSLFP